MSQYQAQIVMAFAKNNMSIRATAKELYMNDANVAYHLKKIQRQMGFNPRNFFDLCLLVGVAQQRMGGEHK